MYLLVRSYGGIQSPPPSSPTGPLHTQATLPKLLVGTRASPRGTLSEPNSNITDSFQSLLKKQKTYKANPTSTDTWHQSPWRRTPQTPVSELCTLRWAEHGHRTRSSPQASTASTGGRRWKGGRGPVARYAWTNFENTEYLLWVASPWVERAGKQCFTGIL